MPKLRSSRKDKTTEPHSNKLDKYLGKKSDGDNEKNKMADSQPDKHETGPPKISRIGIDKIEIQINSVQQTLTDALDNLKESIKIQISGLKNEIEQVDKKCDKIVSESLVDLQKGVEFSQGIAGDNTKRIMQLEAENKDLLERFCNLEKMYQDQSKIVKDMEKILSAKILNLERYSREFNLRFGGVQETDQEDCRELIAEHIVKNKLFPGNKAEILSCIENAHRTGSQPKNSAREAKQRQIIAKFYSRPTRNSIVRAARKSVNKDRTVSFSVYEDLPQEDYLLKRNAQKQMNQAFSEGKKARFWRGKLWINSKLVTIEK